MTTEIGIGVSTRLDSFAAGKEAATNAYYQLERRIPNIIIVFISTIFNQGETIKGIRSIIKETPLVGCSSAGSLTSSGSFRDSVSVCAISSDSISFSCGIGNEVSKNPRLAGSEAAKAARHFSKLKNITNQVYIMFSDGLSGNGGNVLRGTQEFLGTGFPIIGGCATDNLQFRKTYQYLNNNIYTDSTVGLLLSGNINIGIGNAHGWQPIGRPHKITKAKSNIVKEIDRKKAVELYEEYLSKSSDELKRETIANLGCSYPLGMQIKEKKEYLIRLPLEIGDNGSLMLTSEIPEEAYISLMIGDRNLVLDAAKKACLDALKNIKKPRIKFAIVFSDVARLKLLKKDSQKEVEIIKDILGTDVPFFGCYTCGEYAPIEGQSCFHNQTVSVAVFSE